MQKIYIDICGDANRVHALDKLKELGYTWWYDNRDLTEDYDYVKNVILCVNPEDKTVTWRYSLLSPLPREELDKHEFGNVALSVDEVMSADDLLKVEGDFKISEGQEVKDFGYTVYHADTGERAKPTDIKLSNGETLFCNLDEFILDDHGNLGVCPCYAEDWRTGFVEVKKDGKYIIQFADGRYMRY